MSVELQPLKALIFTNMTIEFLEKDKQLSAHLLFGFGGVFFSRLRNCSNTLILISVLQKRQKNNRQKADLSKQ